MGQENTGQRNMGVQAVLLCVMSLATLLVSSQKVPHNLPVLFQYADKAHNVAVFRGAELRQAIAAGLVPGLCQRPCLWRCLHRLCCPLPICRSRNCPSCLCCCCPRCCCPCCPCRCRSRRPCRCCPRRSRTPRSRYLCSSPSETGC